MSNPPNTQFRLNKKSPQAKGLVGWWPFIQGGSNFTRLVDYSGYGHHGTYPLATGLSWAATTRGFALEGVGTGGHAAVTKTSALQPSAVSVFTWVYRKTGIEGYRYVINADDAGTLNDSFRMDTGATGDNLRVLFQGSIKRSNVEPVDVFDLNTWVCVGITFANGVLRIYKNGNEIGSDTGIGNAVWGADPVTFMARTGVTSTQLIGYENFITYHNRAFSASEVLYNYHNPWELCAPLIPIFHIVIPGVAPAGIVVTPTVASAIADTVAPAVILGSLSLTPVVADAIADTIAPSVQLGSMTTTPTEASAIVDVVNPAVELGSVTITPTVSDAIVDVSNPTVIRGSLSTTPNTATTITEVVDPAVLLSSMSITPVFAGSIVDVIDPGVVGGSTTVTPVIADAIADVVAPTVLYGSAVITPVFASAIARVVNPIVLGGVGEALESKLDISTGLIL